MVYDNWKKACTTQERGEDVYSNESWKGDRSRRKQKGDLNKKREYNHIDD